MEMPGQSKDFEFAKYRESKQLSKGDQEMDNSEYLPPAFFFFISPHLLLTPQLTNLRHLSWKKNSSLNIDLS